MMDNLLVEEKKLDQIRFVSMFLENDIDYDGGDVFFVEVENGQEAREGTSRFNLEEIAATEYILRDLMKQLRILRMFQ